MTRRGRFLLYVWTSVMCEDDDVSLSCGGFLVQGEFCLHLRFKHHLKVVLEKMAATTFLPGRPHAERSSSVEQAFAAFFDQERRDLRQHPAQRHVGIEALRSFLSAESHQDDLRQYGPHILNFGQYFNHKFPAFPAVAPPDDDVVRAFEEWRSLARFVPAVPPPRREQELLRPPQVVMGQEPPLAPPSPPSEVDLNVAALPTYGKNGTVSVEQYFFSEKFSLARRGVSALFDAFQSGSGEALELRGGGEAAAAAGPVGGGNGRQRFLDIVVRGVVGDRGESVVDFSRKIRESMRNAREGIRSVCGSLDARNLAKAKGKAGAPQNHEAVVEREIQRLFEGSPEFHGKIERIVRGLEVAAGGSPPLVPTGWLAPFAVATPSGKALPSEFPLVDFRKAIEGLVSSKLLSQSIRASPAAPDGTPEPPIISGPQGYTPLDGLAWACNRHNSPVVLAGGDHEQEFASRKLQLKALAAQLQFSVVPVLRQAITDVLDRRSVSAGGMPGVPLIGTGTESIRMLFQMFLPTRIPNVVLV